MFIREVTLGEIPETIREGGPVFASLTGELDIDIEYTVEKFQSLFKLGILTILRMFDDDNSHVGSLAYLKSPGIYSPKITAVELYWFVYPGKRGTGHLLVEAFEKSAKDKGCDRVAMVHLSDSFPETLKEFYIRGGYHLTENHFVKEI